MDISVNQSLVILALVIACARTSKSLTTLVDRLQRARDRSRLYRTGFQLCALATAVPEVLYSSKTIDLVVQFSKG